MHIEAISSLARLGSMHKCVRVFGAYIPRVGGDYALQGPSAMRPEKIRLVVLEWHHHSAAPSCEPYPPFPAAEARWRASVWSHQMLAAFYGSPMGSTSFHHLSSLAYLRTMPAFFTSRLWPIFAMCLSRPLDHAIQCHSPGTCGSSFDEIHQGEASRL